MRPLRLKCPVFAAVPLTVRSRKLSERRLGAGGILDEEGEGIKSLPHIGESYGGRGAS
jgi:hypothetical protein